MTSLKKRRLIIIGALLACVMSIAGLFFARSRRILSAAGAEPTSGELYFRTGAAASLDGTNLYRLQFTVNVKETAFLNGGVLRIEFSPGYGTDGGRLSFDAKEIDLTTATKNRNELEFTNGIAEAFIYVTAPLYQDVQLTATVGENTATSDARSIYYIWSRLVETEFEGENISEEVKGYIRQAVTFSSSDSSAFAVGGVAQLSADNGLSLLVKVPDSYLTLLRQGRTRKWSGTADNVYEYTDYFLRVERAEDLTKYGSLAAEAMTGTGYLYHIEQTEYIDPPSDIRDPYRGYNEIPSDIIEHNAGVISLPIPTEAETTYYYYAQLVEVKYKEIVSYAIGYEELIDFEERTIAFTTNYYETSVKTLSEEILSRNATMSESERAWLQDAAGIAPDASQISVMLKYKTFADYATVTEKNYAFSVKSVWAQNKTLVLSALYDLTEYSNIAKLNAVYTGDYWRDGYVYTTQKRIILQARDFEYSYDAATEKGTLEVVYNDFQYKDLSLRVTNNDPANNLTLDYYTSDVEVGLANTTLTYTFADIEEQLHNSCNWLFDFGKDNIRITGVPEGVSTELTEEALIVTFPNAKESELVNLSLIGVAEIIEDVEYTLTYEYAELTLNGTEIIETWKTSSLIVKMYSEIVTCNYTNFMTDYGDAVRVAVNPEFLGGAEYYIPASIRKEYSAYDSETHTCKITVEYTYNTLFCITNNVTDEVMFKALNHSGLTYTGGGFVTSIPSGYRVKELSTSKPDKLTVTNAEDYRNAKIEVRTSTTAKEVLPVEIVFTDSWNLIVNYLEDYADYRIRSGEAGAKPCFAEKKRFSGTVKVKDYADIYALTSEDVKSILGIESLDILGLATVESIGVTFDGVSTYKVNLSYTHAALKQIDYDGNMLEIKIPLTSYAEWCKQYGQDWSILFLNTPERHYFKYSNDVARENLYGFFSVAVFKEQVSDLNYWFQNNTGDGCMTIFEGKEVSGSGVYKFFDNLTTKGIITSALGYVGMAFCEIADDDNAMYYSYFFYLDGTSDNAYLATNGADSADDTGSAIKNAFNDAKEWIQNIFDKFSDSTAGRIVKIILGAALVILAGAAIFAGVYKLLKWSGIIKPKKSTTAKKPKKTKKTSKKKTSPKATTKKQAKAKK